MQRLSEKYCTIIGNFEAKGRFTLDQANGLSTVENHMVSVP